MSRRGASTYLQINVVVQLITPRPRCRRHRRNHRRPTQPRGATSGAREEVGGGQGTECCGALKLKTGMGVQGVS